MEVNLNRVVIEGRLCANTTAAEKPAGLVVSARIANADDYRKRGGEEVERTNFVPVIARNALGEILRKASVGDLVTIEGKLLQEVFFPNGVDGEEVSRLVVDATLVRLYR